MSKSNIIPLEFQGQPIGFTDDGWFNATEAAAKFGKRPNDWLSLDSTKEYLAALEEALRNQESRFLKVKRGGRGKSDATWMHPKLAVPFARWLDAKFAVWCDLQIDTLIRGNHPAIDWKRARHQASATFRPLMTMLLETRKDAGKEIAQHHFSNEARLVNFALTGRFEKLDRDIMPLVELDLLAALEVRDMILIGKGMDYAERKDALVQFAAEWRAARQQVAA